MELLIKSTLDGTAQPSLFFPAKGEGRPLLVGLHTWSYDRHNPVSLMLPYAENHNFSLLCPDFRGANLPKNTHCTEACGSILAKQDIKDAIDEVISHYDVDRENVFLIGLSGGGHMAMLMAGYCPEYFKAIGAIVPITDLSKWTEQNASYRPHVMTCCSSSKDEMLSRSPISYIDRIATANLKIFHGKWDPIVPVEQSLSFYRRMMSEHPDARLYIDIFDGGHEIDMESAMHWLITQGGKSANKVVAG